MGSGFGMIPVGGSYLVQSVPAELNMDHTVVLQQAEVGKCVVTVLIYNLFSTIYYIWGLLKNLWMEV